MMMEEISALQIMLYSAPKTNYCILSYGSKEILFSPNKQKERERNPLIKKIYCYYIFLKIVFVKRIICDHM